RGFRPPSIFEATYADYVTNIPNPALRSEEISSAELSSMWKVTQHLAAQAYVFRSTLSGLIRGVTIASAAHVQGDVVGPRAATATAGRFVEANLRGLYRTRLFYPVTLHLDVLNLFDSKGTVAASPVYAVPTLPIEGRRVLGGIEVRF